MLRVTTTKNPVIILRLYYYCIDSFQPYTRAKKKFYTYCVYSLIINFACIDGHDDLKTILDLSLKWSCCYGSTEDVIRRVVLQENRNGRLNIE